MLLGAAGGIVTAGIVTVGIVTGGILTGILTGIRDTLFLKTPAPIGTCRLLQTSEIDDFVDGSAEVIPLLLCCISSRTGAAIATGMSLLIGPQTTTPFARTLDVVLEDDTDFSLQRTEAVDEEKCFLIGEGGFIPVNPLLRTTSSEFRFVKVEVLNGWTGFTNAFLDSKGSLDSNS